MSIDPISFIPASQPIGIDSAVVTEKSSDFGAWLDMELTQVNKKINDADSQLAKLATGETDNLHQVMMSMEDAKLSFQLVLQIRNHVLDAYQELLRTQV
jgi:flagellar hook-basal body complex protein FliE